MLFLRASCFIIILVMLTSNNNHTLFAKNKDKDNNLEYKLKIVDLANKLVDKKFRRFRFKDRYFKGDCSGFVEFIYATQHKNLINHNIEKTKQTDSLANKIYLSFKKNNKVFFHKTTPHIGDIIFFHNTYDQNRNNKIDDLNTHVGIVTEINKSFVYFVHYLNKNAGIKKDKISIDNPHSIKHNSFIRNRKKYPHPKKYYLTGELFAYFARTLW